MSQQKVSEVSDNIYTVKASYYAFGINDKGQGIEIKKPNQIIELYHLKRRNIAHSQLAMKVLAGNTETMTLATEFIKCCVVDEKLAEELVGDALACVEIYNNAAVLEDFERFFTDWEFLNSLPSTPSPKK